MVVAKAFGIYVKEFSIGMGPLLYKYQGKETQYSIRALPLGGYNMMIEKPEDNNDINIPVERTLYDAQPYKRILVLLAGAFFNIVTGLIICIGIYVSIGAAVVYPQAKVLEVVENSPAYKAGIQANDIITRIEYEDGDVAKISDTYDITINNALHNDDKQTITIIRNDKTIIVELKPEYSEEYQKFMMGVQFEGAHVEELTFGQCIIKGIQYAWELLYYTIDGIKLMLMGTLGTESISGTIGIYNYTAEAVESGIETYFALVANISMSLAVMNLLPIPVLDGGRVVLTIIEKIIGHRLDEKVEQIILYIGLALVVAIFLFSTYADVPRLISK